MPELEIGQVSDFFAKPVVAGITLTDTIKTGDKLHIKGTCFGSDYGRLYISYIWKLGFIFNDTLAMDASGTLALGRSASRFGN